MQTEASILPVVALNANKNVNRKEISDLRISSMEAKACSPCRNTTCLSSNRKTLHPLLGGPYRSNVKQPVVSERSKLNKTNIGQRVLSAKMLRVKQLQNQLADAHYHLNELANENRLLKALQKRQDSALRRYEGASAELPRIINSHHEELRVLQSKYKNLKTLHKETCELLKEKENELQCLQSQNKHLLQLSKDRNLGEREKLQLQVSDLSHRIQQQQDTIQMLQRKMALENKTMKHQLHVETTKRKETQKILQETEDKLKSLESLLDNRERRLYSSGQLPIHNKERRLGSQSLTNLRDTSRDKKWQKDIPKNSLPLLNASEPNEDENVYETSYGTNSNQAPDSVKTETMASLQQIRKYRLQKSVHAQRSSCSLDDMEQNSRELNFKAISDSKIVTRFDKAEMKSQRENATGQHEISAGEFRRIFEHQKYNDYNGILAEYNYSSEDTDSENEKKFAENHYINATKNSREFHARLISSTDETSDTPEDLVQKIDAGNITNRQIEKRDDKLSYLNYTFKSKLKNEDFLETDSDIEHETKTELKRTSSPMQDNNNIFKSTLSKYNDHRDYLKSEELRKSLDLSLRRISEESRKDSLNESTTLNSISSAQLQTEDILANNSSSTTLSPKDDNHQNYSSTKNGARRFSINYTSNVRRPSKDVEDGTLKQFVANEQETYDNNVNEAVTDNPEEESQVPEALESNTTTEDTSFKTTIQSSKESPKRLLENSATASEVEINKQTLEKQASSEGESRGTVIEISEGAGKEVVKDEVGDKEAKVLQNLVEEENFNSLDNNNPTKRNGKSKVNFNKERLLATIKAIDNNENIEYLPQNFQKFNITSRRQITENLYRGLPTQTKRKQDIIKDIFETDSIENKTRSTCSKMH